MHLIPMSCSSQRVPPWTVWLRAGSESWSLGGWGGGGGGNIVFSFTQTQLQDGLDILTVVMRRSNMKWQSLSLSSGLKEDERKNGQIKSISILGWKKLSSSKYFVFSLETGRRKQANRLSEAQNNNKKRSDIESHGWFRLKCSYSTSIQNFTFNSSKPTEDFEPF